MLIGLPACPTRCPHRVMLRPGCGVVAEPGSSRTPESVTDWPASIVGALVAIVNDGFSACWTMTVSGSEGAGALRASPANQTRSS